MASPIWLKVIIQYASHILIKTNRQSDGRFSKEFDKYVFVTDFVRIAIEFGVVQRRIIEAAYALELSIDRYIICYVSIPLNFNY